MAATQASSRSAKSSAAPRARARTASSWGLDEFQKALRSVEAALVSESRGELTQLLGEQGIRSPLIVISEEPLRLQRLVLFIHERLFGNNPQSLISTQGNQLNQTSELSSFLGLLLTPSLFAGPQLIVIWNGEKMKTGTEKAVTEALSRPLNGQLVIVAVEAEGKKSLPLAALREQGTTVTVPALDGDGLRRWIAKEVERFGIARAIDEKVTELLARAFEGNLAGLSGEIQRLSLVAGRGSAIESKHLIGSSLPSPEQSSNELTKSLLRGDSRSALLITKNLLDAGLHPLQISAQLSKAYRAILAERGHDHPLHKDVNAPWLTRQLGPTRAITEQQLSNGIEILKTLDLALKDSGLEAEDSLVLAVEKLCRNTR